MCWADTCCPAVFGGLTSKTEKQQKMHCGDILTAHRWRQQLQNHLKLSLPLTKVHLVVQFGVSFHEVKVFQSTLIEAEAKSVIIPRSSSHISINECNFFIVDAFSVHIFFLVNSFGTGGHVTVVRPTLASPVPSFDQENKRKRKDKHVSEVLPALSASLTQTPAAESRVVLLQGSARRPALFNLFFFIAASSRVDGRQEAASACLNLFPGLRP